MASFFYGPAMTFALTEALFKNEQRMRKFSKSRELMLVVALLSIEHRNSR